MSIIPLYNFLLNLIRISDLRKIEFIVMGQYLMGKFRLCFQMLS